MQRLRSFWSNFLSGCQIRTQTAAENTRERGEVKEMVRCGGWRGGGRDLKEGRLNEVSDRMLGSQWENNSDVFVNELGTTDAELQKKSLMSLKKGISI